MTALYAHDPATATAVPYPGVDVDLGRAAEAARRRARAGLDRRRLPPLHADAAAPRRARRRAPAGAAHRRPDDGQPPAGQRTLTEFGRPLLDLVINEGYGFGLGLSPLVDPIAAKTLSVAGEYRWEGAAGTAFWVDPAAEMTVLFFTQVLFGSDDAWVGMRPLVYQALVGT